jgi:hypothetical protein
MEVEGQNLWAATWQTQRKPSSVEPAAQGACGWRVVSVPSGASSGGEL